MDDRDVAILLRWRERGKVGPELGARGRDHDEITSELTQLGAYLKPTNGDAAQHPSLTATTTITPHTHSHDYLARRPQADRYRRCL